MPPRYDQYGDVVVPGTTGAPLASLASTCDPAVSGLLSDFATIIKTKLDAQWLAASGGIDACGHVVGPTFLHEPDAYIARLTWEGPALFMWRATEKYFLRTQCHEESEATVKLAYVLPPMQYDIVQKLEVIRTAVRSVLLGFVRHFGDTTLHPSGDLLSSKGIDSFTFTDAKYGYFESEFHTNLPMAALDMTALMREREEYVSSNYQTLSRIDSTVTSKDDTGETTIAQTRYTP